MNLRGQRQDNVEINLVSLIDVLLFLVIFFMVSSTFIERSEIALTLPKASVEAPQLKVNKIEIAVDSAGHYYVNGQALANTQLATIKGTIAKAAKAMKDPVLVISADAKSTHQSVIRVLDAARQLRLLRVTFATEIPPDDS